MDLRLLGLRQGLPELVILLPVQGTIDVIRASPVVAGGKPGFLHINGPKGHERSRSVEEMQVFLLSKILGNARRQGI